MGHPLKRGKALRARLPLPALVGSVSQARRTSATSGARKACGKPALRALPQAQRAPCLPRCAKPGEPHRADGARRAPRPLHRCVCVCHAEHGQPPEACQGTGTVGRGRARTQSRCLRGVAEGASESADGQAVHTGMRTPGAGPSPGECWRRRESPAQAPAEDAKQGGRKVSPASRPGRKACTTMCKLREGLDEPKKSTKVRSRMRGKPQVRCETGGVRKRAATQRALRLPNAPASLRLSAAAEGGR